MLSNMMKDAKIHSRKPDAGFNGISALLLLNIFVFCLHHLLPSLAKTGVHILHVSVNYSS
jgi:hypothetical protein